RPGRLLERLQERVLRLLAQAVRVVEHAHLTRRHERLEYQPAGQLAHLLDADVAALRVARHEVQVGVRSRADAGAVRAGAARVARTGRGAEETGREGVGERALADARLTDQEHGRRYAAVRRRVSEPGRP